MKLVRRNAAARSALAFLSAGILAILIVLAPSALSGEQPVRDVADKGPGLFESRGPKLTMPTLNPARGRKLFAARGCVVCHSVNGVGGRIGPSFDISTFAPYENPFEFAARMWRGAEAMIALQNEDLGYQIDIDGEELGDITAFAYDRAEQRKFSERDIPRDILKLMKLRRL